MGEEGRPERKEKNRICMDILFEDHAGDRTENPSICSRTPYHWATQPFPSSDLVLKIDLNPGLCLKLLGL